MAFTITKEKLVVWPVCVRVPVDGGGVTIERFKARFAILGADRVDELSAEARTNLDRRAEGVDGETGVDVLILRAAIRDLTELQDEDKQPVAYGEDIRDALLRIPYVRSALFEAYTAAAQGRKAKN